MSARDDVLVVVEAMYPEIEKSGDYSFALEVPCYDDNFMVRVAFTLHDTYPQALSCSIIGGLYSKSAERKLSEVLSTYITKAIKTGGEDEMLLINVISLLRGEENDGNINDIFTEALRVREVLKSDDENVAGQQLVFVDPNVVWHHSQPIR